MTDPSEGTCRKAILLLSGGMDSSIAGKLVIDQGVEVIGVKFSSPFCQCDTGGTCNAKLVAESLDIVFRNIPKGEDYLEVIRNPRFGYGKNLNPCIDCRIFMLKKTHALMEETGADFIITGEVLGQRPKSQHRRAIELIEREAGLDGLILRPLSSGLLQASIPEKEGWVDPSKWPKISGRSRKVQYELIRDLAIEGCSSPAGGCLLTVREFAGKLRDLLGHKENIEFKDIHALKVGRHFRINGTKVIIGRNEAENRRLADLFGTDALQLEASDVPSPLAAIDLSGAPVPQEAISITAGMVLRYSDAKENTGDVMVQKLADGSVACEDILRVEKVGDSVISEYRI